MKIFPKMEVDRKSGVNLPPSAVTAAGSGYFGLTVRVMSIQFVRCFHTLSTNYTPSERFKVFEFRGIDMDR